MMSSRPSFVLRRNNAADYHHDVLASELPELLDDLRNEGLVTRCEGGYADDVHVVLHSLLGCLRRSLEERTHIHIEAAVGITGSHNLGSAVVSVLTQLGDHDTGLTAFLPGELGHHLLGLLELAVALDLRRVNTCIHTYNCFISSDNFLACIRDLAEGGVRSETHVPWCCRCRESRWDPPCPDGTR